MRPLPCIAMKLISSGVVFSAASVRSPSFSRSSSSTTTSIRPARKSSSASGMGEKGINLYYVSSLGWRVRVLVRSSGSLLYERAAQGHHRSRQRTVVHRDSNVYIRWGVLQKLHFDLQHFRPKLHFVTAAVAQLRSELV